MSLQELDEFLLKAVNNNYQNPVLDQIMICLSDHVFLAIPVIVAFFYFCVKKDWNLVKLMLLMGMAIGLLDSFCTFVLKANIQRFRPCHALDYVRIVTKCGGKYGYVSNHASNSFALATFLYLGTNLRYRWLFYVLAFLVALSRVYLGVHYPFDVMSGAILGSVWAYAFFKIYRNKKGG